MIMRKSHRQSGLSLIELMIAMVLGLIVVAAVYNMYTGSTRSSRFSQGLQNMQENGRYGVAVLQRGFRLAGFSRNGRIPAIDVAASNVNTVVIRSQQPYDCNGGDTTATGGLAVNTYRLDTVNDQLTCEGNQAGATRMAIVEGVEEFRLLYGIDSDGDDDTEQPQAYVTYDALIDPAEITAIRFALLVNSGIPIRSRNTAESFVLLDTEVARNDRMAREVFSSTVKLRNRL